MIFNKVASLFLILSLALLPMAGHAAPAPAASSGGSASVKRAKIVVKSAVYGFGGGLVVGLASQVFKKKAKNIFMFGSLGMYAGILLGVYIISTSKAPAPYEGPDTYEDFSQNTIIKPINPATTIGSQIAAQRDLTGPTSPALRLNLLSVNF